MSAATNNTLTSSPMTLGDLLYADPSITRVDEKEWLALIRGIAAGQGTALRVLFERTQPILFTYVMRLTGDPVVTEQVILDVFQDLWCEAPIFDSDEGPVLGWLMRRARELALAVGSGARASRQSVEQSHAKLPADHPGRHGTLRIEQALKVLSPQERDAIEAAILNGQTYVDLAAQLGEPVAVIKSRLRKGMAKLRQEWRDRGEE